MRCRLFARAHWRRLRAGRQAWMDPPSRSTLERIASHRTSSGLPRPALELKRAMAAGVIRLWAN
jgi:hypothetical protein